MLNQIEKLTEQLQDKNIKLPLLLRIQKLNVLRKLLFDTGRVEESDQVANELIKFATLNLSHLAVEERIVALDVVKRAYMHVAPRSFHHYLIALEWNREPKNRFYQPRMRILKETVNDLTKLANKEYEMV